MPPESRRDAARLKEIHNRFDYVYERWKDIREQHDLDQKFRAGEQWDDREKANRKDKHRPMVVLDELTQYINQLVNDVRENKREAKVEASGYGATAEKAEKLENWVRAVQYESTAQSAYITGFEETCGASYGFWGLETYYKNDHSFDLSVRIRPIPNGNTILFDPDCLQYDCSDAEDCFEINFISQKKFKRDFPNATIKEFTDKIRQDAPNWFDKGMIQLASHWTVEVDRVALYQIKLPSGDLKVMRDDELPPEIANDKKNHRSIMGTREVDERRVVQTVLNGAEILEVNDPEDEDNPKGWPGKWIPIIPCWGKEIFVQEASGSKRYLLSMIRLARDPQRLLNYYGSQEMEEAKLTPKTPYMGPKGMFDQNRDEWAEINDVPKAFIDYTLPEGMPPGVKPERVPFQPNFQAYQVVKESAKRAIMSAMGISPLPTPAQRANEKSGVALERIEGERQQGTFHFIDNFDRSLEFTAKQLVDIFPRIHVGEREIGLRKSNGDHVMEKFNIPGDEGTSMTGEYAVTTLAGPSYKSQREEASAFVDTFVQHAPQLLPLVADLMVKIRKLGPIGDEIAKRLTPPQFANQDGKPLDPQAVQQLNQAAQQVAQLQTMVQQLQDQIKSKSVEIDGRKWIAALQEKTKLIVAQASLQKDMAEGILQSELIQIQALLDAQSDAMDRAHEAAMASHQAELDKDVAAHAASLTPPPGSEQNAGSQPNANGQ